ncbi:MAG: F0F1 ATP synthase subunit alpha [Candidatus Anstonellales archaeon]
MSLVQKIKASKVSSLAEAGEVVSVGDGVLWVKGLMQAKYGEVLEVGGSQALVMNLEEDAIGAVVLGSYQHIKKGDPVFSSGKIYEIAVGEGMLGRVINPLGEPLDEKGALKVEASMPIERIAPGIVERQPVNTSLTTGIMAIDAMIPIGRGQRQLIIGDRGTGKTAIAIDTIINQKDVICIYVAIGQKLSKIAQVVEKLDETGALKSSIVVSASAGAPASVRFVAPYAATAIGEYFMGKGRDVLVVYDDLSKHAWSYRELSLLLRRPSGREAYPGDVFYLHSRLLERACRLNEKHGGGSLTALPIIETQAGDVSAYIPTNVISVTDGQIYLEPDLFFAGIRPALNVGLSVSRVGGAAQSRPMKKVAGKLRLDLAQYYELATFAQFATDTDETTRAKIERGKRVVELLKQPQYAPIPIPEQVITIFLANSGFFDDVQVSEVNALRAEVLNVIRKKHKAILENIASKNDFT